MESIVQFRQMMAEQKFLEVQKLIEVQLSLNHESRHELLLLYHEALKSLDKKLPSLLALELAELESSKRNHDFVAELLSETPKHYFYQKKCLLKLKASEDKGQLVKMYNLLCEFLLHQFEQQVPNIPPQVSDLIQRFYRNDFNLKLNILALKLLLNDIVASEKLIQELIESCVEKSSPKGTSAKLNSLAEVLIGAKNKAHLEIYQNYCLLSVHGVRERSDYKKIVEMVIFFEEFKFQVMVLNLLHKLELHDEANLYADYIRTNKNYDFVYLDKYFPHLKSYFVQLKPVEEAISNQDIQIDLKLTEKPFASSIADVPMVEQIEDEDAFLNLLKYQTYSAGELCELAVSFLQSEMPRVALKASELAIQAAPDDKTFLKGSYLKLTSLLLLNDNRSALDTCLEALKKSHSTEDVLSFLYGQAEALIRLNKKREAKKTLSRVLAIDPGYRLARERLEKL